MRATILLILFIVCARPVVSQTPDSGVPDTSVIQFDFCGVPVQFNFTKSILQQVHVSPSQESILLFYNSINNAGSQQLIKSLIDYKTKYKPDDWLYYQLIRQAAQHISPKAENYLQYTLCKWYLLTKSGYDAIVSLSGDRILFYVRCDENIYNIPTRINNDKQYVCLNYHDYGNIDFQKDRFTVVDIPVVDAERKFSYRIKQLPAFNPADYQERDLRFNYHEDNYRFKVRLNPQIQTLFKNYPTVDYESQLNIPLSQETYKSLIPLLKKNIKGMNTRKGVDYLMRFTRYAFLFETDSRNFGSEKRLSPEQTLLYEQSDCEDRVALFFCLVKEIYNLPMIVLSYPNHVTIAVQFDKPVGKTIAYNGNKYSICEPTPQKEDLPIGRLLSSLHKSSYEVVYNYIPGQE